MLVILSLVIIPSSKSSILSPQFGIVACFIPSIVYAFSYVGEWDLQLSDKTMLALILGIVVFVAVSTMTAAIIKIFGICKAQKTKAYLLNRPGSINDYISNGKIILLIILQTFVLFVTILFLYKNFGTNLSAAIIAFRKSSMDITSDDYINLPGIVRALRRICLASGYIIAYLLVNGVVYQNKKNRFLEILCYILTILNGLILGGRGDALQLLAATLMMYWLTRLTVNGKSFIRIKDVIKVLLIVILIIGTFSQIGELLGRNMKFLKFGDYIAIYLSAELKNLDTFLRTGILGHKLTESQTLANIINAAGNLLNHPDWVHRLDNPFRYYRGHALGNISTMFYAFLYDAGYKGVVFFTSFMAIFCQVLYRKACNAYVRTDISIPVMFYSYIWFTVIFSFFSDKFYEIVISTSFLWALFSWLVLKIFFMSRFIIKRK